MFDSVLNTPVEIKFTDQEVPENLAILRCVMKKYRAKISLFVSFYENILIWRLSSKWNLVKKSITQAVSRMTSMVLLRCLYCKL